jgi:hypothetical protein
VVEHEAPQRTVHRTSDIPLSRELEVAGEGEASEVTITLRGEAAYGPLGVIFASLMKGQVEGDNRRTVESFAELVARELATLA